MKQKSTEIRMVQREVRNLIVLRPAIGTNKLKQLIRLLIVPPTHSKRLVFQTVSGYERRQRCGRSIRIGGKTPISHTHLCSEFQKKFNCLYNTICILMCVCVDLKKTVLFSTRY